MKWNFAGNVNIISKVYFINNFFSFNLTSDRHVNTILCSYTVSCVISSNLQIIGVECRRGYLLTDSSGTSMISMLVPTGVCLGDGDCVVCGNSHSGTGCK